MFSSVLALVFSAWILQHCVAPPIIRRLADRIIHTSNGKYRGVSVEFPDEFHLKKIESYRGIQYGNIGRFRFMPPNHVYGKWKNIRNVSNYTHVCPQKRYDVSNIDRKLPKQLFHQRLRIAKVTQVQHEDCLNLNLFVPLKGEILSTVS